VRQGAKELEILNANNLIGEDDEDEIDNYKSENRKKMVTF
jgi:hypothetical protein